MSDPKPHRVTSDPDDFRESGTGVFSIADLVHDAAPEDRARVVAGRYEILEHVGAGAMGQVLHVRHMGLGKEFALKLMQAEFALDPEARKLFVSEARLASALSHPNIVSTVDFGEDPDWGLFLTMELLDGDRLSTRISDGKRMPVEIACHVARQLADALDHSHQHGVVHGDVKSENIICTTSPADEHDPWFVKLLDFGTARLAYRSRSREEPLSGTPGYMAPERIVGNAPAPSNDLYALGIVLYELLAGSIPFSNGNPLVLLESHLRDEPEPVAARRGEVLDDTLVAIVDRCLAKDPANRYAAAVDLVNDLSGYMNVLGIRERARAQRSGVTSSTREESAADAFDALALPAASITADGTIRLANAAFARLLGAASIAEAEGNSLQNTPLGALHSGLRDDLRLAAMHRKLVRRRLRIRRSDDTEVTLRLILSPAHGRCGACVLVAHPL